MDFKAASGVFVAVLAGLASFVASPNWPVALLIFGQCVSIVVIALWVRGDMKKAHAEREKCERSLRRTKWAMLRLYHSASLSAGGKRRPLPSITELFDDTKPPQDADALEW